MDEFQDELPPHRSSVGTTAALVVLFAGLVLVSFLTVFRGQRENDATGGGGEEMLASSGPNHPAVGNSLPPMHFPPLHGADRPVQTGDWKGKVVLLNFWGPWCGFCREEFPHLMQLRKRFESDADFRLASVSYPSDGSEPTAVLAAESKSYLSKQGYDLPVYHDPRGQNFQALALALHEPRLGFPVTVLIDRAGKLRGVWLGYVPAFDEQMSATIQTVLAERSADRGNP